MQTDQNNNGQSNQRDQFDDALNQQPDSSPKASSQSDGQTLSGSQNRDEEQEWGNDIDKPGSLRSQDGNPWEGTNTASQADNGDSGPTQSSEDYSEATGEDFEQGQQGDSGTLSGNTNTGDGSKGNRTAQNVDSSRGGDEGEEPENESSRSK